MEEKKDNIITIGDSGKEVYINQILDKLQINDQIEIQALDKYLEKADWIIREWISIGMLLEDGYYEKSNITKEPKKELKDNIIRIADKDDKIYHTVILDKLQRNDQIRIETFNKYLAKTNWIIRQWEAVGILPVGGSPLRIDREQRNFENNGDKFKQSVNIITLDKFLDISPTHYSKLKFVREEREVGIEGSDKKVKKAMNVISLIKHPRIYRFTK
jgi:hypothetical protein